ncbi:MAG: hypothetical protein KKE23_04390 [Nanoarchaeota archaeon]|nr:hypothetical protein [Nanoarchaeota archaeon]
MVSAQCLDVKIARGSYFSGETFQAEITGNLSKPLTEDNIHFYNNNKEYYPFFNLVQVSSNKWLVYFDVAKTYGENMFSVSTLCKEDILRPEKKETPFIIKKTYDAFYNLVISKVDRKWNSISVENNALAILALSYNQKFMNDGKTSLLSKSFQSKCFPSTCNIKDTSLALMALDKANYSTEKIVNWLHDSENNVKIGLWDIIISSSSNQTCQMAIGSNSREINILSGINPFDLSLPDDPNIPISLNCSVNSAKISHTLMGEINEFPLIAQNNTLSITLNNNKCWGTSYRSICDATSTAYAILALKTFGETLYSEINWLKQNAKTTEEKSISYSLGDSELYDYLINNQAPEGYWSESSLAISPDPSVPATVSAMKYLKDDVAKQKGEEWLFNTVQSSQDLKETLLALQIFSYDKIGPLLSFSPGFFKVSSETNQTITLSNKGIFPINATVSIGPLATMVSLNPLERKEVKISIPSTSSIEFTSMEIEYSNTYDLEKAYIIPIIIYPKFYSQSQIENISSGIVETSFIESKVSFMEQSLNKTLAPSSQYQFELNVRNSGTSVENVTITFSGLFEVLDKIIPSDFEIASNETKKIMVYFDTTRAFGEHNGIISLETKTSSSIPVYIAISSSAQPSNATIESPKTTGTAFNMKYVGWGMVILAIVVVATFLYFKLKKKQKPELMIALEKLKKEQFK